MAQIIVNGNVAGESNQNIQVLPVYDSGIKIADIIIDGQTYPIYIPSNQQGGNS